MPVQVVEVEGLRDSKNPDVIQGSKTYMDEMGCEVTSSWRLVVCGGAS